MAAEKTFSRINAGESMAFPGRLTRCALHSSVGYAPLARGCCTPRWLPAVRFIRCVQHPRAKGAPTIAGKTRFLDADQGFKPAWAY